MIAVIGRDRANAVIAEKLVGIEHFLKNRAQPLGVHDR